MSIKLEQLTKIYNPETDFPVTAVNDVTLNVDQGEFVAIMGPSGSGKTTLLNMVGGIDRPNHGQVFIDTIDMTALSDKELILFRRDNIGFIFQDFSLLPVLTAKENVEFVMQLQGRSHSDCETRSRQLLEEVGLGDRLHVVPGKLSGGQHPRRTVVS